MKKFKRAYLIVLDSYGIGAEPDAAEFGDGECHTLQTIAKSAKYDTPQMKKLGLFNIDGVDCEPKEAEPAGASLTTWLVTTLPVTGAQSAGTVVPVRAGRVEGCGFSTVGWFSTVLPPMPIPTPTPPPWLPAPMPILPTTGPPGLPIGVLMETPPPTRPPLPMPRPMERPGYSVPLAHPASKPAPARAAASTLRETAVFMVDPFRAPSGQAPSHLVMLAPAGTCGYRRCNLHPTLVR